MSSHCSVKYNCYRFTLLVGWITDPASKSSAIAILKSLLWDRCNPEWPLKQKKMCVFENKVGIGIYHSFTAALLLLVVEPTLSHVIGSTQLIVASVLCCSGVVGDELCRGKQESTSL